MTKTIVILGIAACTADVPSEPSFQVDVLPVLAANCVRCHGDPPLIGPRGLRLDSYGDLVIDEGGPGAGDEVVVSGAASYAAIIASRIEDDDAPMPPRFGLDAHGKEILLAWWDGRELGDPPPRGAPRPDNRPPSISVVELARDAETITLRYDVHDPDGDLVAGQLRLAGPIDLLIGTLHSGRDEVVVARAEVTGTVEIVAHVDDGAGMVALAAGSLDGEAP